MRLILIATASALALAACSKPTEPASSENAAAEPAAAAPAEPAAEPATDDMAGMDHSGHDMGAMSDDMAAMDSADDASTDPTPNDHTFHTYPKRTETIRLEGEGTWALASIDQPDYVTVASQEDVELEDGTVQHVIKMNTMMSGNAVAILERYQGDEVVETRTVNFMIH